MRQRLRMIATLSASVLLLALFVTHFSVASEVSAATTPGLSVSASAAGESRQSLLLNANADDADSPSATMLDSKDARGVLGSAVRSATDEDMGRIVDVIVDRAGTTRAAVIDFGGFLGVGSRKIAVDWNAMQFNGHNHITLEMTRDQVKAAPQYQPGKPVIVLGASASFAQSRLSERMPER